jgi:probable rRNA maturation factor
MALHYEGPQDHADFFQQLTETSLATLGAKHLELSVTLCDDATIRPINLEWRGVDSATDVLSFPQLSLAPDVGLPASNEDGPPTSLGDIVISQETAARQAVSVGHSLQRELSVLFAHGLCHLLGHTHNTPHDTKAMAAAEGLFLPDSSGLVARSGVLQ